jgi:hypothetical protein
MYFSFSFSSKSRLVAYAIANHFAVVYATTNHFYQVPPRTIIFKVTKMVDLDKSRKCMGWNGQDFL